MSKSKPLSLKLQKMGWLLLVVFWDQVVYTLINMIFQKSKFLNLQKLYKYLYTFNCIYCLFSGILMPNFALQQAFANKRDKLVSQDSIHLATYLVDGIKFNFIILIFSAANFKLFQPFLLQQGKSFFNRLKAKKRGQAKHRNLTSENIFVKLQMLKDRSELAQQLQENENSSLIFSLSFTTNCIISVSFYGLLIPSVVYYIFPAMISSFALDYYRFSQLPKQNLKKLIQNIRENYSDTIEEITPRKSKKVLNASKNNLTKKMFMLKRNKYCRVQKVPTTIFVNFLNVLTIMTLPSCLLGYFGMTIEFQSFLVPTKATPSMNAFFSKVYSFAFYSFRSVVNLFNKTPQENLFVFVVLRTIKDLVVNTLKSIQENLRLQILVGCYLVYLFFYRIWYSPEKFLSRTQSKIWEKNDIQKGKLTGESFRDLNPAYWM